MTDTSTEVKEQKDIIQAEKSKRSKYKVFVLLYIVAYPPIVI